MPSFSPPLLLVAAIAITLVPLAAALAERYQRRLRLARLARQFGCSFGAVGATELAQRVAAHLPALGAAHVRVLDLIVCESAGGAQMVVGRVDYLLGSVRHKRDNTRILVLRREADGSVRDVAYAPNPHEPRIEQYRRLLEGIATTA